MDKAQLVEIANTEMPFGKYKGRRLIDVPEEYLLWFARKDQFPAGHLGELMALTLLIKTEGLSDLVQPPEESALGFGRVGLFLSETRIGLLLVAPRQHRADHQLDLVEDHQRQHHDAEDGGREENIGHRNAVGRALFEPQKTMVISSALLKPQRRATKTLTAMTMASSTRLTTTINSSDPRPTLCQMPFTTASLKAE